MISKSSMEMRHLMPKDFRMPMSGRRIFVQIRGASDIPKDTVRHWYRVPVDGHRKRQYLRCDG